MHISISLIGLRSPRLSYLGLKYSAVIIYRFFLMKYHRVIGTRKLQTCVSSLSWNARFSFAKEMAEARRNHICATCKWRLTCWNSYISPSNYIRVTHVDCCLWLLLVTHTVRKVEMWRLLLGKTVERVFKAQADFCCFFQGIKLVNWSRAIFPDNLVLWHAWHRLMKRNKGWTRRQRGRLRSSLDTHQNPVVKNRGSQQGDLLVEWTEFNKPPN